jgi:hypothetical protein
MTKLSVAEIQRIARESFGRDLSEAQAEAYRGRLPTMARIIERVRQLEPQLRDAHPAQVMRMPKARRDG